MVRWFERLLLVVLIAAGGCGQSDRERLEKAEKSVRSWAATVDLVDESYARGSVTDQYVEQIAKAAQDKLEEQRKELAKLPADDVERNAIDAELARAQDKAQAMQNAAQAGGGRRS